MTIATDTVDQVMIESPRKMDLRFIKQFMIVFGIISSLFDYLTFAILLFWLHADQKQFRTGWLVESIVSAALIVLIVRTSQAFYKSKPGKYLLAATIAVVAIAILIPFSPLANILGLVAIPFRFYGWLGLIILGYVITAEYAKTIFYKWVHIR